MKWNELVAVLQETRSPSPAPMRRRAWWWTRWPSSRSTKGTRCPSSGPTPPRSRVKAPASRRPSRIRWTRFKSTAKTQVKKHFFFSKTSLNYGGLRILVIYLIINYFLVFFFVSAFIRETNYKFKGKHTICTVKLKIIIVCITRIYWSGRSKFKLRTFHSSNLTHGLTTGKQCFVL